MTFAEGDPQELAALYDNCAGCTPDTYFTAFHYDARAHAWATRWMRGGQGVPVWSANGPPGVDWTQVYAGLAEPNGRAFLCTWSHFDYGKQKPVEDVVYRFDLDPGSGLDRTQLLSGKDCRRHETAHVPQRGSLAGPGPRPGLGAVPAACESAARAQACDHPAGQ